MSDDRKDLVVWQATYSVGIGLIDGQHKTLIDLTNKLFSGCLGGKDAAQSTFIQTVHELVDYVNYHFGTEEKIMERVNYPGFKGHKGEHVEFIRQVLGQIESFKAGKLFVPLTFAYYLRDWILNHIAINDKKLGSYLLTLQRSGELHTMTLKIKKNEAADRVLIH